MQHSAIVFAEPTWIAARVLQAWLNSGNSVAEVWCFKADHKLLRPPRGITGRFFPGWDTAWILRRHGIRVRLCPPLKAWPDAVAEAKATGADVLLSLMSLQIIPKDFLDHFGDRAINVHPALLPLYKGPSPRLGMVLDGRADEAGGVTLHVVTPGIDEGPIIAQRAVPLSPTRDFYEWEARTAEAAAALAAGPLIDYLDGRSAAIPQAPGSGFYCRIPDPVFVHPGMTAGLIASVCKAFGTSGRLRWRSREEDSEADSPRITRLVRVLGKPTGAAPRITRFAIEADCADARIRLRRRSAYSKPAIWALKARALVNATGQGGQAHAAAA